MHLKIGMGVYIKKDSQQNHQAYVLSLLILRYNETCGLILALSPCGAGFLRRGSLNQATPPLLLFSYI